MIFLGPFLGLAASNFLYQYFNGGNWAVAMDRTWFQSGAVLACWLTYLVSPSHEGDK